MSETKYVFKKRGKITEDSKERVNVFTGKKDVNKFDGKGKSKMKSVNDKNLLSFDDEGFEEEF